jgi:hypothetical protein
MIRMSTSVSASYATRSVTPPASISIGGAVVPVAALASLSDVTSTGTNVAVSAPSASSDRVPVGRNSSRRRPTQMLNVCGFRPCSWQ